MEQFSHPEKDSLPAIIGCWAKRQPGSPALITPGQEFLTYQGLAESIEKNRLAFVSAGVTKNDRVAVVLPPGPEMVTAFLSVSSIAPVAPLNPTYTAEEFAWYLRDLQCTVLISLDGYESPVFAAAMGQQVRTIRITPSGYAGDFSVQPSPHPVLQKNKHPPPAIALLLHTSGTTAKPKIVPLHHRSILFSTHTIAQSLRLDPTDRTLAIMPLFHVHGLVGSVLSTLVSGGSSIIPRKFEAERFLEWVLDAKPTWYSAVPAMHHAILSCFKEKPLPGHTLRFIRSCSSPISPGLFCALEDAFGVPVIEAYGMTEACHQIASNPLPPEKRKMGSVGIPTGCEIAILGSDNNRVSHDTEGEVIIRGSSVISGYENNHEADLRSFYHGWFRTSDSGYIDEEGYLYLKARIKEIINKGGEKIAPREIDEIFLQHPAITQAASFAVPHTTLGEDIGIVMVVRKGYPVPERAELVAFAKNHCAPFKIPSHFFFRDEIPKGPTGKIRRHELAGILVPEESGRDTGEEPGSCSDRMELQVLGIWQEVLRNHRIRADDDFFYLGGDSLQAVRIIVAIEELFKIRLQPGILLEKRSVRELTGHIRNMRQDTSPMICLNHGTGTPLFLAPGADSGAFSFKKIADKLGDSFSVYSWDWPDPDTWTLPDDFHAIARFYADQIRNTTPSGPYQVGGFCFGGSLALEIGSILQMYGEEIETILLIDPIHPSGAPFINLPSTRGEGLYGFLMNLPIPSGLKRNVQRLYIRVRRVVQENYHTREIIVQRRLLGLMEDYTVPDRCNCRIVMIFSEQLGSDSRVAAWRKVLGNNLISKTLPGAAHRGLSQKRSGDISDIFIEAGNGKRNDRGYP
jgi:oxalate---CoA ligase